jgi:hypothetical protein
MPHSGTNEDQPRRTARHHAQVRIHVVGRRSPEPLPRTGIRANCEELCRPLRATAPVPDRNTGAPKHRPFGSPLLTQSHQEPGRSSPKGPIQELTKTNHGGRRGITPKCVYTWWGDGPRSRSPQEPPNTNLGVRRCLTQLGETPERSPFSQHTWREKVRMRVARRN